MSTIVKTCLNDWWDFKPVKDQGELAQPEPIPSTGWIERGFLVPSFWTKPVDAVRVPGDERFREHGKSDSWSGSGKALPAESEYLFDGFGYPVDWNKTRSAWLKRQLMVAEAEPGQRRWLRFEGVMPRCWIYVASELVAAHEHPTLPCTVDVEDVLARYPGQEVELAVRIADYRRDPENPKRTLVPTGNWIPCGHSGIWQDVWLEQRGAVRVDAVAITTSTRKRQITVRWTLVNDGPRAVTVTMAPQVVAWARHGDAAAMPPALTFPEHKVSLKAGEVRTIERGMPWADAVWWEPRQPQLYVLRTELRGRAGEVHEERFGFREIWLEGPDLMLNDHPIHLFSDWGHKTTPFSLTEAWVRQWFGMMRDANLNHTRLHTHPHPQLIMRLADEEGILITGETGLHGSGGAQAADDPRFWDAAHDHVERYVARDRNHPCVIMWSVENEMRWNRDQTDLTKRELPKLRALFGRIDPTRPAYHDGDSSLWSEPEQPVISRHYGKECSGLGWWDRSQPLHCGEMSLYHYSGPNNTLHLGGDAVFTDFAEVDHHASVDTALIVESGRTLGVCCFGPWNLSCLQNFRPHGAVSLQYDDFTSPGLKPLQVAAGASEFRFWEGGAGYTSAAGFDVQAQAFRPLALIDRSRRRGYRPGQAFDRELHLVNDTAAAVCGVVTVQLIAGDTVLGQQRVTLSAERGHVTSVAITIPIPAQLDGEDWTYLARFDGEAGEQDSWTRAVRIADPCVGTLTGTLGVIGNASFAPVLKALGLRAKRVKTLAAAQRAGLRSVVLERGWVQPGTQQHREVAEFAAAGGRVLLLEQETSLFPHVVMDGKPVSTSFIRSGVHPAFAALDDADLRDWGDDSYAQVAADTLVATRLYRKDDGAAMAVLADSGEGGFGNGDLEGSVLFAARCGKGLVVACQYLLTDKALEHPAALRLAANLIGWCDQWAPPRGKKLIEAGAGKPADLVKQAAAGATVMVGACDSAALRAWSRASGVTLKPVPQDAYQAVRVDDPLTAGLSQQDGCGVATWTYCGPDPVNHRVCSLALAPTDGLEPLWVLPERSLLKEMFVDGGRSEPLRAFTRTAMHHAAPQAGVVVGRVAIGKGALILDQFRAPSEVARLGRIAKRMRATVRGRPLADLLVGDCTAPRLEASTGAPTELYFRAGKVAPAELKQMLADCAYSPERLLNRPILTRGTWQLCQGEDGRFTLPRGGGWISFVLRSPVPRQDLGSNLDVPNPEALTFCDCEGAGATTLWVNGAEVDAAAVPGTLSDIALEQGNNHILLKWTGGKGELGLRFRNIMRHPETEFMFG
ncbi:MAG: hypothetical protein PF961_13905 [Planctomycetota bacterium]|jgi:beta-galactosidase|nr:hypothetical protein [Planctomycetota bacterium]